LENQSLIKYQNKLARFQREILALDNEKTKLEKSKREGNLNIEEYQKLLSNAEKEQNKFRNNSNNYETKIAEATERIEDLKKDILLTKYD